MHKPYFNIVTKLNLIVSLGLLLFFAIPVMAQDFINDAALWTNFYFEKKINKHWYAHLNQQNRINENFINWNMSYADLGITYKINGKLALMGDYVLSQNRKIDLSYKTRHQGYIALTFNNKFGRWHVNYRNMLQGQVEEYFSSYDGKKPDYYDRNKLTVKYDLNRLLTFYTAEEMYYPMYQAKNKGFDRSRTFFGMFYNLNRSSKLEAYFLFQRQLNAFGPTKQVFAYGLGYAFEF